MADTRTPEQRHRIMSLVGQKNTKPEVIVRKVLHSLGYRFRLHRKDLPGKPDIVFPGRRKIILVHGCFWHAHNCKYGKEPKSKLEYWIPKLKSNKQRDEEVLRELEKRNWSVLVIWQCETKNIEKLIPRLMEFLGGTGNNGNTKSEK